MARPRSDRPRNKSGRVIPKWSDRMTEYTITYVEQFAGKAEPDTLSTVVSEFDEIQDGETEIDNLGNNAVWVEKHECST